MVETTRRVNINSIVGDTNLSHVSVHATISNPWHHILVTLADHGDYQTSEITMSLDTLRELAEELPTFIAEVDKQLKEFPREESDIRHERSSDDKR